jgi:selenide,water dikinase
MARASGVTVTIEAGKVPVFDGVLAIVGLNQSGGLGSNQEHFAAAVAIEATVPTDLQVILYDPQTSGGLLVAAAADAAATVEDAFHSVAVTAVRIGTVGPRRAPTSSCA